MAQKSISIFANPLEPRLGEKPEEAEWLVSVELDGKSVSAHTMPVAHPTGPLARDALVAFRRDLADTLADDWPLEHVMAPRTEQ